MTLFVVRQIRREVEKKKIDVTNPNHQWIAPASGGDFSRGK